MDIIRFGKPKNMKADGSVDDPDWFPYTVVLINAGIVEEPCYTEWVRDEYYLIPERLVDTFPSIERGDLSYDAWLDQKYGPIIDAHPIDNRFLWHDDPKDPLRILTKFAWNERVRVQEAARKAREALEGVK